MEDKNKDNIEDKVTVDKKTFWILVAGVFFVVSVLLIVISYFVFVKKTSGQNFNSEQTTTQNLKSDGEDNSDLVRRAIDGVYVKRGEENNYPVAIMIDNNVEARPASSLSKANFVYEAEAEGGITRYMAIFAGDDNFGEVGPVRSARPYFVDWAHEFSALYVHCGGSPEALVKITRDGIVDMNEFYKGSYFWRDKGKIAPHNVFTSSENLVDYLSEKKLEQGKFFSWNFKDEANFDARSNYSEITINFKLKNYIVEWKYNRESNNYERYLASEKHLDSSGETILAKNVIIQFIEAEEIDDDLRLKMYHIGTGNSVACIDGFCEEGEWKKENNSSRTRFYNKNGKEVDFNAGTTWIEAVRPDYEVKY